MQHGAPLANGCGSEQRRDLLKVCSDFVQGDAWLNRRLNGCAGQLGAERRQLDLVRLGRLYAVHIQIGKSPDLLLNTRWVDRNDLGRRRRKLGLGSLQRFL